MNVLLYKLTDKQAKTNGNTEWGPGVTHTATGEGTELCSNAVVHAYRDPHLAVLMDPIQGKFGTTARCWVAEGEVVADDGTKVGCKSLTTIKEIPLPNISIEKRVEFAIRCAQQVCKEPQWVAWAEAWLSGKDRTIDAADVAYPYTYVDTAPDATAAAYATTAATAAAYTYKTITIDAAAYAAAYIAETATYVATTKATLIETALAETFGGLK